MTEIITNYRISHEKVCFSILLIIVRPLGWNNSRISYTIIFYETQ